MNKRFASLAVSALLLVSMFSVPALAEASATETAKADPDPSAAEAAVSEEKEDKQLTYVALGDSICAGVGLADVQYSARAGYSVDMAPNFKGYSPNCYVGKVAETLGLDRDHAINLGLPALTAPDLADMIQYGKMPQMNMASGCEYNYPEFQDDLRRPHLHRAGDPQAEPGRADHSHRLHQPRAPHPLLAQLLQQAEQV